MAVDKMMRACVCVLVCKQAFACSKGFIVGILFLCILSICKSWSLIHRVIIAVM